jgi:threonine/homoserine/homoserine lactone efflux protein
VIDTRAFLIYCGLSVAAIAAPGPAIIALVARALSRLRGLLTSVRARRRINQTAAVVTTGAGIAVAAT